MPVRRFRSAEEMNRPVWRKAGDPQLYRAIREVWELGQRTSKKRFRAGVYRFRSIDDMQAAAASLVIDSRESGDR